MRRRKRRRRRRLTTVSMARVDNTPVDARIARDVTTPLKPTPAVDRLVDRLLAVAPVAAEQIAPVHPLRCGVALSTPSAQRAHLQIGFAKVRRILRVDEIGPVGWLDGLLFGQEALAVVAGNDFGSAVEFVLQFVTDLAKRGHLQPARLERARARQAVALALRFHVILYSLSTNIIYKHV